MDNKSILQARITSILDQREIDKTHYAFYMDNLQQEAIDNQEKITDEMIVNQIISKELFWGLGQALLNYVALEKEQ
jgi:hypothetical protein